MLSINPFLHAPRERREDARSRVISILLQGIALHSFSHDEGEFEVFQGALHKLRDEIPKVGDEDSVLLLAGSAIRTLEDHTASTERAVAARQDEMAAAMALISDALLKISMVNETLGVELKESERDIAMARRPGDLRSARARLSKCLEEIRIRVLRRSEAVLLSPHACSEGEIDSLTGLPDSRKAVDAITAAWEWRDGYKVVVFGVRRLDAINARYGFQAGDEMLRLMSRHLVSIFPEKSLLFRWRGPYVLSLIDRKHSERRIAAELQRLTSARFQSTLAVRDREIMLSISIGWLQAPLEAKNVEEMIQSLDELTTIRLRQEG